MAILVAVGTTACGGGDDAGARDSGRACTLLLERDAEAALGGSVKQGKPAEGFGTIDFDSRCRYEKGDQSIQLSVVDEQEGRSLLESLTSEGTVVDDLGERAKCGGTAVENITSVFCRFSQGGSTYLLALRTEAKEDEAGATVREVAGRIASRAGA